MSWCGSRHHGICLISFNPRPFPWRVGQENAETVLLSSLVLSFLILIDLVRCGLSPLVPTSWINVFCHDMWIEVSWNQSPFSLVCVPWSSFAAFLIPFLRFPSIVMTSGSKEGESVFPLFWLFRAQAPCMLVPILDWSTP